MESNQSDFVTVFSNPLLQNPGSRLSGIYYSSKSTEVENLQATYASGQTIIDSTNKSLNGAQSVFRIEPNLLIGSVWLTCTLPAIVANQSLCRGWLFGLIDSLSYTINNASEQRFTGDSLMQAALAELPSGSLKDEIWRLSGNEARSGQIGLKQTASILLPLPWSSNASGACAKKPLDGSMFASSVQIRIQWKTARSVFGGSATPPTEFENNPRLILKQGQLFDRSKSLSVLMAQNPVLKYNYPFLKKESFRSSQFSGQVSGTRNNVKLEQFILGDLTAITFGVSLVDKRQGSGSGAGRINPNPLSYVDITDIRLTYNNQVLYDAPGISHKVISVDSHGGPAFFQDTLVENGDNPGPAANGVRTYIVTVLFSRQNQLSFCKMFSNVWSLSQNSLQLEFFTPTGGQHQVDATYYYNAIVQTDGQKVTRIITS